MKYTQTTICAQSAWDGRLEDYGEGELITPVHGRDLHFVKAPLASKIAPGDFVIFGRVPIPGATIFGDVAGR